MLKNILNISGISARDVAAINPLKKEKKVSEILVDTKSKRMLQYLL